jgi:hypothetical protein
MPRLLAALAASGGNTAAFARERGLAPWKLYEARRVAAESQRARAVTTRRRRPGKADAAFAEVRVVEDRPGTPAAFELVLPEGHRLLIPSTFDEQALRRLLEVLA